MSEEENQPVEQTEAPAPEAPVEPGAPAGEGTEITNSEPEAVAAPPAYEPNYGYKVANEERNFDEWAKPFVTSKEVEDQLRDLYTKAGGIDEIKSSRDRVRSDFESLDGSHKEILQSIEVLRDHVSNKDFNAFFKSLNIPKESVQQWMLNDLNYQQMTPEQKSQHDQRWSSVREATELRRENQELTTQHNDFLVQTRDRDLDQALQAPEVNKTMRDFDARVGRVGAFRDQVIRTALGEHSVTGNDLSAKDAVNQVVSLMGGYQGGQPGAGQAPLVGQPQVIAPQGKPVIPNIQGRNTSPVRKAPRTIEELKAMRDEKYGNQ